MTSLERTTLDDCLDAYLVASLVIEFSDGAYHDEANRQYGIDSLLTGRCLNEICT